ncbi:carbamoyl-phosphate synthase (glutamine-hydrolyzing) cpa2 [Neophaeococcomyces mojaviensis]|uniref:Carbamoyl-phosphate synthase (Glutamine-hydrolyzing) cpa2 n=1 Tax=Neophaeococcomyces mojaviensis TaxID=3383035 RepID=A0ACC3A624_9EURO|nr:carbamoyl-phosphate synthase (glutamine-hydrolyzing) cpa2 [Knufia sp. JES_112]
MALEAITLPLLVLQLMWTLLDSVSPRNMHYNFTKVLPSLDVLEYMLASASLVFAPGLFEVIRASTPPTVAYFKSLPTDCTKIWGVYLLVLEKKGCRPKIYVGSGTQFEYGVSSRWSQYDHKRKLPRYVEQALKEGYRIVHKGLLCWTPIPSPTVVPVLRVLFVAIEATFTFVLWAVHCDTDYGFGLRHICLWDIDTLEYDGACGHNPLMEGVVSDLDLSAEELEAQAALYKERRKETKHKSVQKSKDANPEEFQAKKTESNRNRRLNNPEVVKNEIKQWKVKAIEEKRHHCDICDFSFHTPGLLQQHLETPRHKARVARKESSGVQKKKPHYCLVCDYGFPRHSVLVNHLASARHAAKAARYEQALQNH